MYRLVVDRLTRSHHPPLGSYTVASVGYRVYPDADTTVQVTLPYLTLPQLKATQGIVTCPVRLTFFDVPGYVYRLSFSHRYLRTVVLLVGLVIYLCFSC